MHPVAHASKTEAGLCSWWFAGFRDLVWRQTGSRDAATRRFTLLDLACHPRNHAADLCMCGEDGTNLAMHMHRVSVSVSVLCCIQHESLLYVLLLLLTGCCDAPLRHA